jgi:hypothetical protein
MREDERDRVVRQGQEAWRRLKKEKNYGDWIKVGEAHLVGREWAMHQAGTNEPRGKGYNMAFGEWLTKNKFNDMDKGDRSRLFEVMDNLVLIEDYRQTLTLTERLKLNHPNAVLRKWKNAIRPEPEPGSEPKKPTLRDENVRLSEEGYAKDKRIAELEARLQEAEAARETVPVTVVKSELEDSKASPTKSGWAGSPERNTPLSEILSDACGAIGTADEFYDWVNSLSGRTEQKFQRLAKKAETALCELHTFVEEREGISKLFASEEESDHSAAPEPESTALVWEDCGKGQRTGQHAFEALAGSSKYILRPAYSFPDRKFKGYGVEYIAKPDAKYIKDRGEEIIANDVKTAEEAKTIAQKHHDAHQEGGTND